MYNILLFTMYIFNIKVSQVLLFLLSSLVLIWIIIAFNLLIIFSLLFINRKASRAESRNSKSQSRASSKKSKVESSPDITLTEEEEQAYAEWEAMDKRDCALLENNSQVNEDEEPFHFKWRSTYHFVPLPQ